MCAQKLDRALCLSRLQRKSDFINYKEEKSANLKKSTEYLERHKEVSEETGRAGRRM